jgi:hypothetical protein
MNNKIMVLGGEIGYEIQVNTILAYDPVLDTWTQIGTLPAARSTSVAGALGNNRIISSTGNSPLPNTTTWIGTLT